MAIWVGFDREVAEARAAELMPEIHNDPAVRAEYFRLRALLDVGEDHWFIKQWRRELH